MEATKLHRAECCTFFLLIVLLGNTVCYAQSDQNDINQHVWKPFTKAIMSQDADAFISVHSKDIIRVERDSKKILRHDEYRKNMNSWTEWKQQMNRSKERYHFELRFTERISDGNVAHEVGYFKNESTTPDGKTRRSYGKFHVVLKKESGVWKILVDSDSNEGGSITDAMFLAASPLE